MSRTIDKSDLSRLGEAEALYLHARGELSDDQMRELGYDPARAVMVDPPPAFQVHTGDDNTTGTTQADLDKATQKEGDESLEPAEESLTEPQLQGYEPQEPAEFADAVVDEDDSYDNWKVEALREECVVRGLSGRGNKAQLVSRLEADDRGVEEEPEEV